MEKREEKLVLEGLCCAECARRIEEGVARLEGVTSARINFATQELAIETHDHTKMPEILRKAARLAKEIEPDLRIGEKIEEEDEQRPRTVWLRRTSMLLGAILLSIGLLLHPRQPYEAILFLTSYVLIGGEVLWYALKNMTKGRLFDEHFLMSVATGGAFAIGQYPEGVAVMLLFQIGAELERRAVNRSRKSISALMDIRPDYANLRRGGEITRVAPETVQVGEQIVVHPGEKVPLDGRVTEGISSLDTSALTGESLPRDIAPGGEVLAGMINGTGLLTVEVSREYSQSTVAKILELMRDAAGRKAAAEGFITKFARYYTPSVLAAATLLAVLPPLFVGEWQVWIYRALTFLMVSCPCALVISIPLTYFGGLGGASRSGILVKGGNYLEALTATDTVVFDKTGTLTKGSFHVKQITGANGWSEATLLEYAAYAESGSKHPIALSILEAYGNEIDARRLSEQEEIPGKGVRVRLNGKQVLAGNSRLMEEEHIAWQPSGAAGSVVYLAVDGVFAGQLTIADELKPDSAAAIKALKALGIRVAMLTGDIRAAADAVAREAGIETVYAELLPQQKIERLEEITAGKAATKKVVFVGDGINDAPVLARADVGIAMGALGSDAAIEAADVVLMTDELSKLVAAIRLARRTKKIVWQNILLALGVKVVLLILAAGGLASMWEAVFGDVGVTLLAVLNATRAMKPCAERVRETAGQ